MAQESGPYVIPDNHVALIGRIIQAWAALEFEVDRGIWNLANTHQQLAACITSQFLSIHPRLDAFTALAEVRGSKQAAKIKKFHADIGTLTNDRNRTTHDPRFKNKTTGEIHRLQITSKPVQFAFIPENTDELESIHTQIADKVREFKKLRDEIVSEIQSLPPESLPLLRAIVAAQ